jgi:hypothetical protein
VIEKHFDGPCITPVCRDMKSRIAVAVRCRKVRAASDEDAQQGVIADACRLDDFGIGSGYRGRDKDKDRGKPEAGPPGSGPGNGLTGKHA